VTPNDQSLSAALQFSKKTMDASRAGPGIESLTPVVRLHYGDFCGHGNTMLLLSTQNLNPIGLS
jgi:hypothetical protein